MNHPALIQDEWNEEDSKVNYKMLRFKINFFSHLPLQLLI